MGLKIAITGTTGGLGKQLVLKLAGLNHDLVFINRNVEKSQELKQYVNEKYPNVNIENVVCDLLNIYSVKSAVRELEEKNIDVLILNSGIYNVPIFTTETGYNNVFTVNFISQYYLARKLVESKKVKKVVVVGSIAQKWAKINDADIDYTLSRNSNKIYGNSKKYLMFSLYQLLKENVDCAYSIAHPGITQTNLTSHYPKVINWIVKLGMKIVFPSAKRAVRCIVSAVDNDTGNIEWIGPKICNIWGKPKKKLIKHVTTDEIRRIGEIADNIYNGLSN